MADAFWGLGYWSSGPKSLPLRLGGPQIRADQALSRDQGTPEKKSQTILLSVLAVRLLFSLFKIQLLGHLREGLSRERGSVE